MRASRFGYIVMAASLTLGRPAVAGDVADSPPPPLAQAAPDVLSAFDSACMATVADEGAATAKASAAGFTDPNDALDRDYSPIFPGMKFSTKLTMATGAGTEVFIAGAGPSLQFGKYHTRVCAFAVTHSDDFDIRTKYRAKLGIDPDSKKPDQDLYSFQIADGAPHPISLRDNAAITKALDDGSYRSVLVRTAPPPHGSPTYDIIVLMVPYRKTAAH
jgi:hypothetical protein